jgi:hypothetical protein
MSHKSSDIFRKNNASESAKLSPDETVECSPCPQGTQHQRKESIGFRSAAPRIIPCIANQLKRMLTKRQRTDKIPPLQDIPPFED